MSSCLKFWNTEYVPGARKSLAADDLPDGKAYYRSKIIEFTTLDMDPAEIHKLGEQEVAIAASADDRCDEGDGIQGRLPGVPEFPAHRSAIRGQDAAGTARQGGVDRQEIRRQGGALFRPASARALRHQAGAGRHGAVLHLGPRRAGRLSAQHLRSAAPPALQSDGADVARKRAGACVPDSARRRRQDAAGLPPLHLHLGLWRGLGALLRISRRRDGHVRDAL